MKISFGQSLQQKQTQALAPRMIQSMEILQMAQAALEDRIEQELVENPTLERNDRDLAPTEGEEDTNSRRDKENDSSKEREIEQKELVIDEDGRNNCLLYTSPSPRDATLSRMPSSA